MSLRVHITAAANDSSPVNGHCLEASGDTSSNHHHQQQQQVVACNTTSSLTIIPGSSAAPTTLPTTQGVEQNSGNLMTSGVSRTPSPGERRFAVAADKQAPVVRGNSDPYRR